MWVTLQDSKWKKKSYVNYNHVPQSVKYMYFTEFPYFLPFPLTVHVSLNMISALPWCTETVKLTSDIKQRKQRSQHNRP